MLLKSSFLTFYCAGFFFFFFNFSFNLNCNVYSVVSYITTKISSRRTREQFLLFTYVWLYPFLGGILQTKSLGHRKSYISHCCVTLLPLEFTHASWSTPTSPQGLHVSSGLIMEFTFLIKAILNRDKH